MPDPDLLDGRFRVEKEIGRGTFGVVLEVTDITLERRVALKIGPADPPELKARILREARAAAQLHTRHVAQVHRVGELPDGRPFIAMDLLSGRTVAQAIADERRIEPKIAVDWMLQALDALAEAHEAGLVHRDVKPANLFLVERAGRSPLLKVLDFGLVKDANDSRLTQTGDSFGTPAYVSPEQIRDAARADARSDVWGIGVTLYEMLAGRPPFEGDSVQAVLRAIERDEPKAIAPARLMDIISKCLAKNPSDRYADGRALARALEKVRPKKKEPAPRWMLFLGALATGMVIAATCTVLLWPKPRVVVATAPPPPSLAASTPSEPEVVAPLEPTQEAPPAPRPSAAPRTPGVEYIGNFAVDRKDAIRWVSRNVVSIQRCMMASTCLGKDVWIDFPDNGPPRQTQGCKLEPSVIACMDAQIPSPRVFSPEQLEKPAVFVYVK